MKTFYYKAEQFLPIGVKRAWDFFSSAKNLVLITPPELDLKILSEIRSEGIYEGMIIDYNVKPFLGIPVRWRTEICEINKPLSFTDRQLAGPYRSWVHKHCFFEKENGILLADEVKYALYFGWVGNLVHSLIVRKKIEQIFDYRRHMLHKIFATNEYTRG